MVMAVIIDRFDLWLEFCFMVLTYLYLFLYFLVLCIDLRGSWVVFSGCSYMLKKCVSTWFVGFIVFSRLVACSCRRFRLLRFVVGEICCPMTVCVGLLC